MRPFTRRAVSPLTVLAAIALLAGSAALAADTQTAEPAVPALVELATNYVENYESKLGTLVATTVYADKDSYSSLSAGSNAGVRTTDMRRTLRGGLLLAFDATSGQLVGTRDIASIDNKPTDDYQDLPSLLRGQTAASVVAQVRHRNNNQIAFVERNVDLPTFALQFLEKRHVQRVQFTRGGATKQNGDTLVTLRFEEKAAPTLMQVDNARPVHASGEITIDAATGSVRKTILRYKDPTLKGQATSTYALDGPLGLWLPDRFIVSWDKLDGSLSGDEKISEWRRPAALPGNVR